eukprot:XP_011673953.1 PREDICTED: uncharacterized protein LOC100891509 isoform X3 [Strongylocentrotus purpuratus]
MGEWTSDNMISKMNKWQNRLDSTDLKHSDDIHQIEQKQYSFEGTTNVWQKSKQSDPSHSYDPFREDEPRVCALETLHLNSTMRKHLCKGQSFDMSEIGFNVDVPYDYTHSLQPESDIEEYIVIDDVHGDSYDPVKADEYLLCQDCSGDVSDAVLTVMGKDKRKWRFMRAKQQRTGPRQPIRVDSMEDTLNKLKKSDKPLVGKPKTLLIPKSNTTSDIGTRDGDKTPSGAFRPIKSEPALGTQMDNVSKETSTQCNVRKTNAQGIEGGMLYRQKRTMSMPEAPTKGKLKKLQSQISSVFKKRESYPHDEAYTRCSRKRYVSSSSSSSSETSPIIASYLSSPEVFQDEPFCEIDIDVEEIEKEASEFENIVEPSWVSQSSILLSHSLVHQNSQEECTETEEWVVSKSGEYMYLFKEPNAHSEGDGFSSRNQDLPAVNADVVPESHAAISVEKGTGFASSCGSEGGVSGSSAQLPISRHCTSSLTLGTMNNEFQLTDGKFGAVSPDTISPGVVVQAHEVAELCIPNDNGINHNNRSTSESPEQGYSTAPETDNMPECQESVAYDSDENDNSNSSSYSSCDETVNDKFTRDLASAGVFSNDSEHVIITASLPVGPNLIPQADPIPMLMDAPPPRDTALLDGDGEDEDKPGGAAEDQGEEPEDGEVNYSQHVGASLVNNTMAIMLLIDHKLGSGSFQFSPSAEDNILQDDGPDEGGPEGDIDAVQFQYQDPDENLEEDNLLMARTLHYMNRQQQELDRSKSFGNSVSKAFNEAVSKLEMGHDSRNKQFHKLFPCVPDSEQVINTYSCALVKDILLQGRMFVSENWLCFHSNIFSYEKQIAIKVETITKITKERTAFVVPNAIGLQTPSEKHIFGSLLSRHSTHQLLYRVWKNAKGETESMSPSSSQQGDSDEDDIPGDSDDEDELDLEHEGPNGRVLPPVSVHDYQRLEPSRFSDSYGGGSHPHQGSPRQPRLPSDQSHSMGDSPDQGHRSHTGYHHQLCQSES